MKRIMLNLSTVKTWCANDKKFDLTCRNSYHLSMTYLKAILSEKGQVTIPKAIREQLGFKPGEVIIFEAKKGQMIGKKKPNASSLDEVVGLFKGRISGVDAYLDYVRGTKSK